MSDTRAKLLKYCSAVILTEPSKFHGLIHEHPGLKLMVGRPLAVSVGSSSNVDSFSRPKKIRCPASIRIGSKFLFQSWGRCRFLMGKGNWEEIRKSRLPRLQDYS
jgi:hypothetical protein